MQEDQENERRYKKYSSRPVLYTVYIELSCVYMGDLAKEGNSRGNFLKTSDTTGIRLMEWKCCPPTMATSFDLS